MATNKFRHQRLLDIRDIMLQLETVDLKRLEDAHVTERLQLEAALIIKSEHMEGDQGDDPIGARTLHDFRMQAWHTEKLNQDIRDKIDSSKTTAEEAEIQRTVVAEKAKTKLSLEKLKEQAEERARVEGERADQKAMDEVASRKFIESSHGRATG